MRRLIADTPTIACVPSVKAGRSMARRIGMFLGSVGSNSGGPERYERELVRNMAALDHESAFEVICLNRAGPGRISVAQANFAFHTLWPANRVVSMITSLPIM